jgi:hypothetical protein
LHRAINALFGWGVWISPHLIAQRFFLRQIVPHLAPAHEETPIAG